MSKLSNPLSTVAGLLLLVALIVFAAPRNAISQNPGSAAASKPSASPTDVNVVNAPTVVLPSGTTVGIGSFANTVKVDTTSPLLVSDVDNPARHPFTFSSPMDARGWPLDNATKVVSIHVPDNQRLVVEQVSVLAKLLRATDQSLRVFVQTKAGPQSSNYHVAGADFAPLDFSDSYIASSQLKMYADPGTDMTIFLIRGNHTSQSDTADVNLSGYLVSVP